MREVEIPGGTAVFLEPKRDGEGDELTGRSVKLMKAASLAAISQFDKYPEVFEAPREGESDEDRMERLGSRLQGLKLDMDQALALDTLREATVVGTLHSWTLDRRLPTMDTIGDLPPDLYEALLDAVGGMSAVQLEENFDPTRNPNDGAPTGGSGSSDGPSTADPESRQTPTLSSGTSPSTGESSSPEQ